MITNKTKWVMLPKETLKDVIEHFESCQEEQDERCGESGCVCDKRSETCAESRFSNIIRRISMEANEIELKPIDFKDDIKIEDIYKYK